MVAFLQSKPLLSTVWLCIISGSVSAQAPAFQTAVLPLLERYCLDCHQGDQAEADIDLAQFQKVEPNPPADQTLAAG